MWVSLNNMHSLGVLSLYVQWSACRAAAGLCKFLASCVRPGQSPKMTIELRRRPLGPPGVSLAMTCMVLRKGGTLYGMNKVDLACAATRAALQKAPEEYGLLGI